jgi:hypothetical protein
MVPREFNSVFAMCATAAAALIVLLGGWLDQLQDAETKPPEKIGPPIG